MLPKSAFIKKFTYLGKKCYECLKKENRLHAKKIKDAVKKAFLTGGGVAVAEFGGAAFNDILLQNAEIELGRLSLFRIF